MDGFDNGWELNLHTHQHFRFSARYGGSRPVVWTAKVYSEDGPLVAELTGRVIDAQLTAAEVAIAVSASVRASIQNDRTLAPI